MFSNWLRKHREKKRAFEAKWAKMAARHMKLLAIDKVDNEAQNVAVNELLKNFKVVGNRIVVLGARSYFCWCELSSF